MRTNKKRAARSAAAKQPKAQSNMYAWPIFTTRDEKPRQPPQGRKPNGNQGQNGSNGDHGQGEHGKRRPNGENGRGGRIPPPPPNCSGRLHQVEQGETVFRLAMAFGVSTEAILAANPQITDPDVLVPGQVVCIPGQVESMMEILNALLTAEKVETALYARGIESPALQGLPPDELAYFQAGLSHEIAHVDVLTELGASVPLTSSSSLQAPSKIAPSTSTLSSLWRRPVSRRTFRRVTSLPAWGGLTSRA